MDKNLWRNLYVEHSEHYERMIQLEDYNGNLIAALDRIHPLAGAEVVELGVGTGRITRQLVSYASRVQAFDLTPAMLRIACRTLKQSGKSNWLAGLADSRTMPLPDACADMAVEGWSFVQIMTWHLETWQKQVGRAIDEMIRVVRPGGTVIRRLVIGGW